MGELLLEAVSPPDQGGGETHRLEVQSDLTSMIARKNNSGDVYRDDRNRLNQRVRQKEAEDLLLDGETRAKKQFDTTRLDVGMKLDEE